MTENSLTDYYASLKHLSVLSGLKVIWSTDQLICMIWDPIWHLTRHPIRHPIRHLIWPLKVRSFLSMFNVQVFPSASTLYLFVGCICLNIFLASKVVNCSSWFDFLGLCHSLSEVGNWPAKPSLPCKHLGSLQVHPGLCSRQTCLSSETNLMHTIDSNLLKIASDKVSQNICN